MGNQGLRNKLKYAPNLSGGKTRDALNNYLIKTILQRN